MIMRNQSLHVLRRPLYLELFLCKYAFGESSYFFPLVFSWKASDDGGSMNDVHICLSLFRASDRQLPLSVKSSFMLSIHIFCCLPRLLFPVIFLCSTLIGVFALSIPNHSNLFCCIVSITVISCCNCFLISRFSLLPIPAIRQSQIISAAIHGVSKK